ncbi:hypothetical protein ACWDV4_14425 [Micromonospora sp. NPDC003197]
MSGRGAVAYPVTYPMVAGPAVGPAYPAVAAAGLTQDGGYRCSGFGWLGGPAAVRDAVRRWLRLVSADAELAPYLVGVDVPRLAGHLALLLTSALGGPAGDIVRPVVGAWRGLGLTEAHHRRVVDYLTGVLWAMDLPAPGIARVGRAFAGEVGW